jgi:hypothetical protein
MSKLSGHDYYRCNLELYIETSEQAKGVDLLTSPDVFDNIYFFALTRFYNLIQNIQRD